MDASSTGFGGSFALPDGSIYFCQGIWGHDSDSDSSNFRELRNLVESLEDSIIVGDLQNSEIFIFTDNSTAQGAFYKGNTPSRPLFELILRLRCIEMQAAIKLFVIHVAGSRTISQGMDGLSRGNLSKGIFAQSSMPLHIPLHLSTLDRSVLLQAWVHSLLPDGDGVVLQPEDWFTLGHSIQGLQPNTDGIPAPMVTGHRWLVWVPPPTVGWAAMEEYAISRHK